MDTGLRSAGQRVDEHARRGAAHRAAARRARRPRMARPQRRARRPRRGARRLGRRLRHARANGGSHGNLRRRLRPAADRLDHRQRGVPVQPDRRHRAVRDRQVVGRCAVGRSAHSGPADRVLLRRLHRRRVGLRHAGRHLRGAAHGARLHTALRRRARPHRQHRPGRVRGNRHADPHAGRGHRNCRSTSSARWRAGSCPSCRCSCRRGW